MNAFELAIAKRYLWAQRRSLSSCLIALFSSVGVAIGTWLLIFVLSASNGFEEEVKNQLIGKDAHFELNLYHFTPMTGYDSAYAKVKAHPKVTAAAPYIVSQAVFAWKKKFSGGVVFGVEPELSRDVIGLNKKMKSGRYRLDSLTDNKGRKRDGIILGYALADRLGLTVGDKCVLYVFGRDAMPGLGSAPKMKAFVLAGLFESGMYQFDESLAYISLSAAQDFFDMPGSVTGIHARVEDPVESGEIGREIENEMGYPYTVIDWKEKNRTLIKWMEIEKVLFGLALGIIIIIAAFNIISSLVMNVNDKRREIGILRAMGATRKNIMSIFILEGVLIGAVGSLIGLVLGLSSCYLQKQWGFIRLPGDVYFVTQLPIIVKTADVVAIMVISNFLCAIAAVIPSQLASRQNPVDAIRYE